ncbi:MAG TPA: serine/threonine-protein kinase [Anaerolineae bacterium]|nr:serine/threonine-protein kinase [Anaerolineae bacterium]HMR66510.1 serine/threonine-protein kinase [Anaerolineae bacterium]
MNVNEHKLIGKTIGDYTIEAVIGRGTVGIVFRALDPQDKVVALKLFAPPPTADAQLLLARFQREARLTASFDHPNIASVIDTGQFEDNAYMVMPFAPGETLDLRLRKKSKLEELVAVEVAWQVADALSYAHKHGVIHRDVKPSNIIMDDNYHAMLTDFGVAQSFDDPRLTKDGYLVGTPAFMAPEQIAENKQVDHRADLYSLGAVLYRMVVGRLPFRGTIPQILHAQVYEKLPLPSSLVKISPETEAVIVKAMAKRPEDRYQDGEAMTQALARVSYQLRENKGKSRSLWQTLLKRLNLVQL